MEKVRNSEVNKGVKMDLGKTSNPELYEDKEEIKDYDTVAEARKQAVLMLKQANQNGVKLGATVSALDKVDGKAIIDKTTKQELFDTNGELKRYADKFYVTLTFDGGTLKSEIKKDEYDKLVIGARYSCGGRISPVNVYGETHLLPVFDTFVLLYGGDDDF